LGLGRKAMFGTQEFPAPLPSPRLKIRKRWCRPYLVEYD